MYCMLGMVSGVRSLFILAFIFSMLQTQYTFQHIFDEYTSQKAIYDHAALPLVEDVLHGKNGA